MQGHDPGTLERLEKLLDRLEFETGQAKASSATVELDQSSQGRLSRMDAIQQQKMAQNNLYRLIQEKRKVEAAIARWHTDQYGVCCRCGDDIEPERLKYDPATPFCSECVTQS